MVISSGEIVMLALWYSDDVISGIPFTMMVAVPFVFLWSGR